MGEGTGGTRSRIQAVALELFTEQGYEKTSLREIAERLGVTKAALYYHFKSKDEIVNSFVEDQLVKLDQLIAWAETQPAGPESRRAIIAAYADRFFAAGNPSPMRFFEQNRTTFKHLPIGQQMRDRLMQLAGLLTRGDDSPSTRLRSTLALFAVHSSWLVLRAPEISDEERRRLVLEVADDLLDRIGDNTASSRPTPQADIGGAGTGDADQAGGA
ncbi:TetR family transcriptional regulator [Micromonospora sonneratiae]